MYNPTSKDILKYPFNEYDILSLIINKFLVPYVNISIQRFAHIEEFRKKVKYYTNIVQSSSSREERYNIQLAVLSLKIQRIGTELDDDAALSQLKQIANQIHLDKLLSYKYRLVYGQYCMIVKEEYLEQLKNLACRDKKQIKEIIDEALGSYFIGEKAKPIKGKE